MKRCPEKTYISWVIAIQMHPHNWGDQNGHHSDAVQLTPPRNKELPCPAGGAINEPLMAQWRHRRCRQRWLFVGVMNDQNEGVQLLPPRLSCNSLLWTWHFGLKANHYRYNIENIPSLSGKISDSHGSSQLLSERAWEWVLQIAEHARAARNAGERVDR